MTIRLKQFFDMLFEVATGTNDVKDIGDTGKHGKQLVCANLSDCGSIHKQIRSEERRVGKECRSRWSPYH